MNASTTAATRAIVHIGLPKTGSTTIQAFLHRNRRTLARRGVAYRRYPAGWPNQTELAVAALASIGQLIPEEHVRRASRLTDAAALQAFSAGYEAWIGANPPEAVTLFCCEILSTWLSEPDQIAALHRWLCQRFSAVCYILYLRRPEDWLLSEYSQRIRNGASLSLADFLAEMPLPRTEVLVHLWRSVVGDQALDVRLMDRAALVKGDLLEDYCAAAGIDPKGLTRVTASNRQLSQPAARAIGRVNAVTHRLVSHDPTRRALRKVVRKVIETVAPRQPALALSAEQRETLRRRFEDDFKTVAPMMRNRSVAGCAAPDLPVRQDATKGNPPWPF